jgi:hypothetical protein
MASLLRRPGVEQALPKAALGLDVFIWLCALPLLLRCYSISALLERIASRSFRHQCAALDVEQVTGIVTHVANFRLFRSRMFPQRCLRQSLALYRTLLRFDYPLRIHFGVRKERDGLIGHSWVTIGDVPVGDTSSSAMFKTVYSHGSTGRAKEKTGRSFRSI